MYITVLTPDKEIFTGDIKALKVPGVAGQFEILNNHAPIVSALSRGRVRLVKTDGSTTEFDIQQGFVEVLNNDVSLLVTGYKSPEL